jgi:hypothetical protein
MKLAWLCFAPQNTGTQGHTEAQLQLTAEKKMAVRCSKCGEELLGAVNRCWKCGQMFALHPEIDGRPPIRSELPVVPEHTLEAIVVEPTGEKEAAANSLPSAPIAALPAKPQAVPVAMPRYVQPRRASTAEMIDAQRNSIMAMGGTVASLVLGVFAAGLSIFWPPAAVIAVLGLVMGIWGLYSPRRNLALAGMLLCCLAIGFGAYGMARSTYNYVQSLRPTVIEDTADPTVPAEP